MRNVLNLKAIKHTLAGSSILYRTTAVASMALAFAATDAKANPTGGVAETTGVTYSHPDANSLVVTTGTDRSIINWQNFDIMHGESTKFVQPGAGSVSLNRVVGGQNASQILGTLTSNGTIVLVNPNGVFFGQGSRVDVAGLIATSANISSKNFAAGNMKFDQVGNADASIVNKGTISVKDGGLAALVAPGVENDGTIRANAGTIELAAGSTVAVDMYGDNLYSFAVGRADAGAKGVSNTGVLSANAGTIELTANVAKNIVNNVVNNTGVIEASSAHVSGGTVIIGGGDGNVNVAGNINASGATGGGKVKITGANATVSAAIDVSATNKGNGGSVKIISDGLTDFNGSILAKGGVNGGNGGEIETSGQYLNLYGTVDASATAGVAGNWLLDPLNITISNLPNGFYSTSTSGTASDPTYTPNFALANVNTGSLSSALNSGTNVTVSTQGTTGPLQGDISLLTALNWTGMGSLTLDAVHDVIIASSINSQFAGIGGNVTLKAGHDVQIGTNGFNGSNGTFGTNGVNLVGFGVNGINGINGLNGLDGANGSITTKGGAVSVTAANDIKLGGNGGNGGTAAKGGNGSNTPTFGNGGKGGNGGNGGKGGNGGTGSIATGTGAITLTASRDVIIGGASNGTVGSNGLNGNTGSGPRGGAGGNGGVGGAAGSVGNASITSASGDLNINSVRNINAFNSTVSVSGKITIDPADLFLLGTVLTGASQDITAHNVSLVGGSGITALTGDLDLHNTGTFSSDAANTLNASNGHINLNQNAGGSIQNAIDAIGTYGTTAKVSLGTATFNEQVLIDNMHDFTLTSINADPNFRATITAPDVLNTTFTNASGPIKAVVGVVDSNNITVSDLRIDGLEKGASNNRIAGIAYNNASGAVLNNIIKKIDSNPASGLQGGYGVYVNADGADQSVEVASNTINRFGKNGIVVSGTGATSSTHDNTITGFGAIDFTAQNGIVYQNGAKGSIVENTISGIGYTPASYEASDILLFKAGDGVSVHNNHIDGAGYAAGIDSYQSNATNIYENDIKNVQDGIIVEDSDHTTISDNTVSGATNIGIWVIDQHADTANHSLISGNVISDTGNAGISVEDSDYTDVTGNFVGYTDKVGTVGAAGNIHGNGIELINSGDSSVNSNFITETKLTGAGYGVYVYADGADKSVEVGSNTISAFGKNGIVVKGASATANTHDNTITGAGAVDYIAQNGIVYWNGAKGNITGNTISGIGYTNYANNVGADIILSDAGDGIDVGGNHINGAGYGIGIYASATNGANIHGNDITDAQDAIVADSLTGVTITDNVIKGTTDFGVDDYGYDHGYGIVLTNAGGTAGSHNLINGNVISDTGNAGISVEDSDYTDVTGNFVGYTDKVGTVGAAGNIHGNGIELINSGDSSVNSNFITETKLTGAGYGVYVYADGADKSVEVGSNTISAFGKNGIVVKGASATANTHDNTITGAGAVDYIAQNGIVYWNGAKGNITGNTISGIGYTNYANNVGADIILSDAGDGIDVGGNHINGAGYGIGIYASATNGANIHGNDITDAQDAIVADSLTGVTITDNVIKGTTDFGVDDYGYDHGYGIVLTNAGGTAGSHNLINGNVISDTGNAGISVEDSDYTDVTGNFVGYTDKVGTVGAAGNIHGNGIELINSGDSSVNSNFITETKLTGAGYGVYVYADGADKSVEVGSNTISAFGKNGIVVKGASATANTHDNTITGAGAVDYIAQNGIVYWNGAKGNITGNTIGGIGYTNYANNVGADIILSDAGDGIDVGGNHINGAGYGIGIYASATNGANIHGNDITDAQDAIVADSLTGVTITDNVIKGTTDFGVDDYGYDHGYGIVLTNAGGTAGSHNLINGNVISDTGNAGISVEDSDYTDVTGNFVGYTDKVGTVGAAGNIAGDGIQLINSNYSTVSANYITETNSTGTDIGSGVYVLNSHDDTIGGAAAEDGNHIANVDWDDIKTESSQNLNISNNVLGKATRIGIYLGRIDGAVVDHNTITDTQLYGAGAITADNGSNLSATYNTISDAGYGNGVDLFSGAGIMFHAVKGTNLIDNNTIHDVGVNGIESHDTTNLTVSNNTINRVEFGNGITLNNILNANVDNNTITNVIGDGIYANNLYLAPDATSLDTTKITRNHITTAGSVGYGMDGIHLDTIENAFVDHNEVHSAAHDGIYAANLYTTPGSSEFVIVENEEGLSEELVVTPGGSSVISNNVVSITGYAGIEVYNSPNVLTLINDVSASPNGILYVHSYAPVVTGNTLTNNGIGVSLTDESDSGHLSGDVFNGNTLGINLDNVWFTDINGETINIPTASGENENEDRTVGLRIANGSKGTTVENTTFTGGDVAVLINGEGSSMQFGDDKSVFKDNNWYFILENSAMSGDTLIATYQTFDGTRAIDFSPAQLIAAEGRITSGTPRTYDVEDDASLGDVLYIDAIAPVSATTFDLSVLDDFESNKRNAYRRGNFSYAGRAINIVTDPIDPGSLDINNMQLSLLGKASPTAAADIANLFANLAPAAGGNHKGGNPSSPAELAALAPAAGGPVSGPSGSVGASCGNNFLGDGYATGFSCSVQ